MSVELGQPGDVQQISLEELIETLTRASQRLNDVLAESVALVVTTEELAQRQEEMLAALLAQINVVTAE